MGSYKLHLLPSVLSNPIAVKECACEGADGSVSAAFRAPALAVLLETPHRCLSLLFFISVQVSGVHLRAKSVVIM